MYQSNSTPSLFTLNALVQCIVQRSAYSYVALLLLCSSVIVPASAQEPVPAIETMVLASLGNPTSEYLYVQITTFHDGKRDWFMDEKSYSYEKCQSLRDERMGLWKFFGDHEFVKTVVYICIPKRRTP